jgi:hypothetical protein
MRTRTVHRVWLHTILILTTFGCTAEEYYKNDYPDEESSEYDTSEGSGTSSHMFFFSLWKQRRLPFTDIFHDDPNDDDNHDWR